MFKSIGFIGAGRIAHIMLAGWQHAGSKLPEIYVYDQAPEAIAALQQAFPSVRAASLAEASAQELVFGALHALAMSETLKEIREHLQTDAIFCSLAPIFRLDALEQKLGGFTRLARMNPNATSIVCNGYNPISFGGGLPQKSRTDLMLLLEPLGACPEVDDTMIETYAVVSAMGPTYFWFQFEQLRQMAESWGMPPEAAREAISTMLHGAVDAMFRSTLKPEKVMDLVPVRPMGDDEQVIREMMQARIGGIYAKLHP